MFSDDGVDLAEEEGISVDAHGSEVAAEFEADETVKPGPGGDGTQEVLRPRSGGGEHLLVGAPDGGEVGVIKSVRPLFSVGLGARLGSG